MGDTNNLKFLSFESIIEPSFWHQLSQIKLEKDMLEERITKISGSFLNSVLMSLHVDYTSFDEMSPSNMNQSICLEKLCNIPTKFSSPLTKMSGQLINFNTLQSFKNVDKNNLIKTKGLELRKMIENGEALENPSVLNQFLLITFAELKTYDFYYWFCFPALSSLSFSIVDGPHLLKNEFNDDQIGSLLKSHTLLPEEHKLMFCVENNNDQLICQPLKYFIENTKDKNELLYICFVDPSVQDFSPGWPLRNLLGLISSLRESDLPLNVIALRIGVKFSSSFVVKIKVEGDVKEDKWVGWEKNARDKFGPRTVNLRNNIDPLRLAESSVDLNLKLMKWRLVRDIDLDIIKTQKCLLLGAGTLGCAVARCLMGWGVRHITFVDSGTVSFSNPVRQSLFTYEDCDLGKGAKHKAIAAAEALKKIFPSMVSSGVILDIPMPGHPTANIQNVHDLNKLIEEHDVVFLLTDSRESRWLPTVIASALNKLAFTVALGFDTYLIMRHGIAAEGKPKLGCYFCNDVTAPGNSKVDRTLDQQCTVTRPGVSYIASATAVELLVSLLQHSKRSGSADANEESILGSIPHSIRGFLSSFSQMMPSTTAFSQCIACSEKIKEEYTNNKDEFLKNVFDSSLYLEKLMGLDELQKLSEMADVLELSDEEEDSS